MRTSRETSNLKLQKLVNLVFISIFTLLDGIPSEDRHVVCKIMVRNCMIMCGTVTPNARFFLVLLL